MSNSAALTLNARLTQLMPWIKTAVFVVALTPLLLLVAGIFGWLGQDLGANPVEKLIHELGIWSLRFLLLTLAITPVRTMLKLPALVRLRRMLGLFAFFYVLMHFTTYAWIDQSLALGPILEDIAERPFITIGMLALVLLIPLAITSTNKMMRRLGRRWQKLHRLVYPIAILGVWHFYWQEKKDVTEPLVYIAILATLLAWRAVKALQSRQRIKRPAS